MRRLAPKFIKEWVTLIRENGIREFLKQKGWKFLAVIVLYYLIRDTILYIIIPYLVINNIL
ncbi:MAG: hypothetical protein GF313_10100 [Caldithrix sp.]|nr:hypothetical protein [Caldithrix sp.]